MKDILILIFVIAPMGFAVAVGYSYMPYVVADVVSTSVSIEDLEDIRDVSLGLDGERGVIETKDLDIATYEKITALRDYYSIDLKKYVENNIPYRDIEVYAVEKDGHVEYIGDSIEKTRKAQNLARSRYNFYYKLLMKKEDEEKVSKLILKEKRYNSTEEYVEITTYTPKEIIEKIDPKVRKIKENYRVIDGKVEKFR